MPKIVGVNEYTVAIGYEDGSLREVRRADCSFDPRVGDHVEVFASDTAVVVNRSDYPSTPAQPAWGGAPAAPVGAQSAGEGGINISISNQTGAAWGPGTPGYVVPAGGKVVDKVAYALLALLLGGLGAHKFYAGQIGLGILYLLFSWTFLPALIGLVEGIVALTKPADAAGNIVV